MLLWKQKGKDNVDVWGPGIKQLRYAIKTNAKIFSIKRGRPALKSRNTRPQCVVSKWVLSPPDTTDIYLEPLHKERVGQTEKFLIDE